MKTVRLVLALFALTLVAPWHSAQAADVICYNCPPEWADWASMLKAIKTDLNFDIPHDNKNSGQALAQILAEKSNPVGDIGYFGVTFGMKAKAEDALEPYKPANWDQVPAGLKDPDGYWTTIHSGTLGLFVNKDALGGKPVPACWKDLLKPDYKGMVGYLDPSSAAVGYVGAVALNLATPEALGEAYDKMAAALKAHTLTGMLVAQQVCGGLELVLGLHRDPEVGLIVMAGTGGVLLELIKDVAFCAPPVSRDKARDMLRRTRAWRLLEGYRGSAPPASGCGSARAPPRARSTKPTRRRCCVPTASRRRTRRW